MGHTLPNFGESGWGVSRTESKEVEGVMREKQDGEGKKRFFRQKCPAKKKIENFASKVPGRIDPSPQPRRL